MKKSLFSILLLTSLNLGAQNSISKIDSLRFEINRYPEYDTLKIKNILFLASEMAQINADKELELYKEAFRQSEHVKHSELFVESAQGVGVCYYFLGDYQTAEDYLNRAVDIARSNRLPKLASVLIDLGQIQDELGKSKISLQSTLEAIEIAESNQNYEVMNSGYNNIAAMYYYKDQNSKALEYYTKARDLLLEHGDLDRQFNDLAITESNIGWVYYYEGNLDKAIEQLKRSIEIHTKYDNISSSSCNTRNSLAQLYMEKGKFELAGLYVNEALSIANDLNYSQGIASCYFTLGEIDISEYKYEKAIEAFKLSFKKWKILGQLKEMSDASEKLAQCYSAMGRHEQAFLSLEEAKKYSDSLTKLESKAAFEDALTKYETEKKEAENALLQEQAKLKDVQLQQERTEAQNELERQLIIGSSIGILLLSGLFFFINRNRLKSKTNRQLALQRDEIIEQKKEITDSITYAKRIQNSFLPSEKDFDTHFREYFLMYEPKDIVAGDFYILEEAEDYIFFSVADCTGHGVPGAMVSIVCSNAIRKVLHEMNEYDPGKVLNHTRDIVIQQFERKGHTVNDGMDISFCRYDKKSKMLSWAGANNALLIIRNGSEEIEEIKPNKQPIGGYISHAPFDTHHIQLNEGDQIYLTSDGYPDQFGGPKGKKYKYLRFKELLLRNSKEGLRKQKALISSEFWEWKQGMEQIDDVCVLGVKF